MISLTTVLFIALALSMDAFAVSIASGIIVKKNKFQHAIRFSITFALFQMVMPILGWICGCSLLNVIKNFAPWVAFGLLSAIGVKMIYEALSIEKLEESSKEISLVVLLGLGLATSMDALAVGFSLSLINISIILPVLIIGIITFLMSFLGFFLGNKFGHIFEKKVEIVAGLILIGIGLKIFFEYLR